MACCVRSTTRRSRPTETKQLIYSILTDNQKHRLEENLEIDFSFGIKGLARFRAMSSTSAARWARSFG